MPRAPAPPRRAPPGHGDIYPSLVGSGMLEELLAAGCRFLFVSNSDNLGATLDLGLLAHFAASGAPFLVLRESAMCPDGDKGAFEDVARCVCVCAASPLRSAPPL